MTSIAVLLVAFLGVGLFARGFTGKTRLLIFLVAVGVVAYATSIALHT